MGCITVESQNFLYKLIFLNDFWGIFRPVSNLALGIIKFFFFKKRVYLFLERGREGERETSVCGCLSCSPYWGSGLQPRHVP